jgi:hypothetical protein
MMECEIFHHLLPHEFLNASWTKGPDAAPNIHALTSLSTRISYLIVTEICHHYEVTERAECIIRAIKIADALFNMSDFNGMVAVLTALDHSAIHQTRLKKSWSVRIFLILFLYSSLSLKNITTSTIDYQQWPVAIRITLLCEEQQPSLNLRKYRILAFI